MYDKEFQKEGVCSRCGKSLSGRQKRWCSLNCSRLGLKREYKKRYPEKVREHKKNYGTKLNHNRSKRLREGGKCNRCGSGGNLNVHHIKPLSAGGTHSDNNLMLLCWDCHMRWEKRMKGYWK